MTGVYVGGEVDFKEGTLASIVVPTPTKAYITVARHFSPKYNSVMINPGGPKVYVNTINSISNLLHCECIKTDVGPCKDLTVVLRV